VRAGLGVAGAAVFSLVRVLLTMLVVVVVVYLASPHPRGSPKAALL
jgi:hypothetical protein